MFLDNDRPFHNRPIVVLPPNNRIPNKSKYHESAKHNNRPVHRLKIHRSYGREEAEESRERQKNAGEGVDRCACPSHSPWSVFDMLTFDLLDHNKHDRDKIGDEKAGFCKRDDCVERYCTADIDQPDEAGDDAAKNDRAER